MKRIRLVTWGALLCAAALSCSANSALADPTANTKKNKLNNYNWRNLQSDIAGVARHTDPNVVNAWGMALSSSGSIWVNDNGAGVATVYLQDGTNTGTVVNIPASASNTEGANPTGLVRNDSAFFKVTKNGNSQPSTFLFVAEDGSISGWNPTLDPNNAILAVDNGASGAIYKGATLGATTTHSVLYVANFHSGKVEMYDENFNRLDSVSTFNDPNLPAGYAPFGIRNLSNEIFVTYALQDADQHDDVRGAGHGFVDVYDTSGNLLRRLISHDRLNSPWGLAAGPATFGKFNGGLYIGNFGDGQINVYDPATGAFLGTPRQSDGTILQFEGLWDLLFANGQLYFTAGIAGEDHGLFGVIFPTK
jgi:uncharacterized protein (TIGR03118 family)